MQKRLEKTNSFRNPLKHFVMLAFLIVLSACGEAVENIEERIRQEKIASTSIITSVSPVFGSDSGGGTLTINGVNLDLVNSVTLEDGTCTILTTSSTILTCSLSSASAGLKDISISNIKGVSAVFSDGYRYLGAPTVTAVSPTVGSIAGNEALTVTGTGFYQISDIQIGTTSCTNIITVSDTTATCVTAAESSGTYAVSVTNADAQTGVLGAAYTYVDPPTISSFAPITIIEAGGEATFTITGTNFDGSTAANTVTIDGRDCPVSSNTLGTTIVCTTPSLLGADGTGTSRYGTGSDVNVVVTNADGGSATSTIEYVPAVELTSIDVAYGSVNGGDTITLTGDWFSAGGSFDISVAGMPCDTVDVFDRNTATCLTDPQTAQLGDVIVTNFDGQTATLTNAFTYRPAPTVTNVSPISGPEAGGNTVTVTGTGFDTSGNFTVLFGAQACTGVTNVAVDGTSFDCIVPTNTDGQYNVTVTNTDDNQVGVGPNVYEYNAAPTITSVTTPSAPFINYGPIAGGNVIRIIGTEFLVGAVFEITDDTGTYQACTALANQSTTSVECTVPAAGAGTLSNVRVTNLDGQSAVLGSSYTYRSPPDITGVNIPAGPINGGQAITISGTFLLPNIDIQINSRQCVISNYISDNSVECTTPDNLAAGGPYDIVVTNEDGQTDTLTTAYEFIPPPDLSVATPAASPTSSFIAGGTPITVTGADFYVAGGVSVTIDGNPCTNVSALTATSFTCETPAHAAGVDYVLRVTNDVDGQFDETAGFFDFIGPPTLNAIYEATATNIIDGGNDAGGYRIALDGDNFQTGMTVTIGAATCAPEGGTGTDSLFVDNNTFECYIPAGPYTAQTEDVVLTNLDTQTTTTTGGFTFRPAPTFATAVPDYSAVAGGTSMQINGTGFTPTNMRVAINGVDCQSTTYVSATELTCLTPANGAGAGYSIEIINDGDLQTTGALGGTIDYIAAPVITSITVPNGSVDYANQNIATAGGEVIRIIGTDLRDDATVTIGTNALNTCTFSASNAPTYTTYDCTTPAAGAGDGLATTVTFTNADGQSTTTTLDYVGPPTLSGFDYDFGPTTGGNTIEVQGANFQTGVDLVIDPGGANLNCASVTGITTTTFNCTLPPAGGLGISSNDVQVINGDTQTSNTITGGIDYVNDPSGITFSPTTLYDSTTQSLTINGTDLYDVFSVTIGGSPCSVTAQTVPSQIVCDTPATNTGTGLAVVITTLSGQTSTGLTIDSLPAPTVTGVTSPTDVDGARDDGGQAIVITGTNFIAGDTSHSVNLGGVICNVTSVPDANTINCTSTSGTPSGISGVTVRNPDLQVSNLYSPFEYFPALDITAVNVPGGSTTGGDTLVISANRVRNSTNGGGLVTVTLDEVAGATTINCTVGSIAGDDSSVTCTTDAGTYPTGAYDIIVTNGDGRSDTLTGAFEIVAAPTISAVSPSNVPLSLSRTLTITGTGFDTFNPLVPTVTVDGEPCTSVVVNSDIELTCATNPDGDDASAGLVDITITNPDNQSVSDATLLTYNARPHIVDVAGTTVISAAGGDLVTINGADFNIGGNPTAEVGGAPCASLDLSNLPNQIICTTAAGLTPGSYDVVVTNADGQIDNDTHTIQVSNPPNPTAISDDFDRVSGGKSVTITGTDFASPTVTVASNGCTVSTWSLTSITCTVTAGGVDRIGDVVVTNGNGIQGTLSNAFEFEETPVFTAIFDGVDAQGGVAGGETVTITGDNFAQGITGSGVAVTIAGENCTGLIRSSATSLQCTTPASPGGATGLVDVVITNPSGLTVTASNAYNYVAAPPTITNISPQGGDTGGGTTVTITGTNFVSGATVTIGTACSNYDYSGVPTTIVCDTGDNLGSETYEDVVVTNPDTNTDTLSNGYLYTDSPTISSISPATGPSTGGTSVVITGTNYVSPFATVEIGGGVCSSPVITGTTISCTTTGLPAGTYNVVVKQLFQEVTLPSAFTYANGADLEWNTTNPSADFGGQTGNVTRTYVLENIGPTATSGDITISMAGADPSLFVVTSDNCTGTSVASGGSCTVDVTFACQFASPATYNADLTATATDGGTTVLAIQGTRL